MMYFVYVFIGFLLFVSSCNGGVKHGKEQFSNNIKMTIVVSEDTIIEDSANQNKKPASRIIRKDIYDTVVDRRQRIFIDMDLQ